MQPIKKALRKSLTLCLILTFCLPLGGVMLGVGLAVSQPAVWAIGIALLVVGFYGTPIGWTAAYAPKKTLYRIVSAVMEEHLHTVQEIAVQLSMVLQAVICQQLVPSVDGKLVPAFEIMTMNPAIRNMIRDGKVPQIDGILYSSANNDNLMAMDTCLAKLFRSGQITKETALSFAANPEMLGRKI